MLKEISIIRPILIILLVLYHAFIVYAGGWEEPMCFRPVHSYYLIANWAYAFMLETFTFISGYIFIYRWIVLGKKTSFTVLCSKKFKRLILPTILFGVFYFWIFLDYESLWESFYDIICGVGHLWYLPMLFWCFVECWLILRLRIKPVIALPLVFLLAVVGNTFPLPLRINQSFYYLFFFYLPIIIVEKRGVIAVYISRKPFVLLLGWLLFVVFFVLMRFELHYPREIIRDTVLLKLLSYAGNNCVQILYSTLGLISFYATGVFLSEKYEQLSTGNTMIEIGNLCFGVYIFQQFILKGLYYHTPIPELVGPVLLPWIGFVLALVLSLLLTYTIRLSKIGREIL